MFTHPLRLAGAVALAVIASHSVAVETLQPVTISASRISSTSDMLPVGLVTLDRDTIRSNPATNTADLLDSVAGVNVRRNYGVSGSRAFVDMLGFGVTGGDNTLLLLNGRKINNPDQSVTNLAAIPVSAIERIEILPGSGSALYGYGASGGVINIVTRAEYETRAGLSINGGDYDTLGGNAWGTTQHNNTSLLLSGQALDSEGYRDNNEVRERNVFADVRHQQDDTTFYFTALAGEERLGLPGARDVVPGVSNDFKDDPQGANDPSNWARQERVQAMPGVEIRFDNRITLNLDAGALEKSDQYWFANFTTYRDVEIDSHSFAPRLSGETATGPINHHWTFGWEWQKLKSRVETSAAPDIDTSLANKASRRDTSWYLHDVIAFSDQWRMTLGARQTTSEADYEDAFSDSDEKDRLEMYQAGIQFRPVPNFNLFANVERSTRLANFDEIGFVAAPLAPQTGKLTSLGAGWREGRQHSTLTFWRGTFRDEIVFDPVTFFNANLPDPTLREGVSLNSHWQLDEQVSLTANASVQRARFRDGPFEDKDIPLVPETTVYAQLDWQATPWMQLTLAQRYTGKRYFGGDEANQYDPLPSYTWTDLVSRFTYRAVWLNIGVYNLQDRLVSDYGYRGFPATSYNLYPLPDRHVMATLGVSF